MINGVENIDYTLTAFKKAEKYDEIKELLKEMFEAENSEDFFEAQRKLKNELRFLP